jgi:hypothetical protein
MTTSEGQQRVLESPDYRAARERLQGNPVISMMAAGVVTVPLAELGFLGGARVRDLWTHRDLGECKGEFAPEIPFHGAGLYRLSPP